MKPIPSTLRIRAPNNFTVGRSSPLTIEEWSGVMGRHPAHGQIALELLEANMIAAWMDPVPWYRRAWVKVADLFGRVPDAWAVLRGRARIETEDW